MDLSVIVANYNTCQLTLNCLKSVYESATDFSYEVIVVDNHSVDYSITEIQLQYPKVHIDL